MAYKVYKKKLSASERKWRWARHERRLAKKQFSFGIDQITQEQINEMQIAVMTDMNNHVRAIVEADHPEALPLVGADYFVTTQQFAAAGMTDILKQALEQCTQEREAFVAIAFLSWGKHPASAEAL